MIGARIPIGVIIATAFILVRAYLDVVFHVGARFCFRAVQLHLNSNVSCLRLYLWTGLIRIIGFIYLCILDKFFRNINFIQLMATGRYIYI